MSIFGHAIAKLFRHYIDASLHKTDVITNILVMHMGTNDILNQKSIKIL